MEGRESMGLPAQGGGPIFARPEMPSSLIGIKNNNNININSNSSNNPGVAAAMVMQAGVSMMKRKRGRPRKYGPDGGMALALPPPTSSGAGPLTVSGMGPSSSQKRGRGRPPGSGRKQQLLALGSGGVGFTPHVITIAAGEDIATKIMSFSQQGPRAVCILSANGAISNVVLRQPAASGGAVTYEGRFDIVSLSGSFLLTDNNGTRSRTGGLSVSLAGPDGRIIGGGVAGMLMAASPVQVIVGSFILDGKKSQAKSDNPESSFGLLQRAASGHLGPKHGGSGSPSMKTPTGTSVGHSVGLQSTQNVAPIQSMG
uniref:AT-hook motif nuclear-localized protein n=1 Tax=Araucaria cunninghamii TaxID=56994 RepID=A0A0D6R9E0_ARACU